MASVNLHESQQGQTLGAIIAFAVLAVVAVVFRLLAKTLVKLRYGIDDYLIIMGLVGHFFSPRGCF
jgi:uncharacterized membrane protein